VPRHRVAAEPAQADPSCTLRSTHPAPGGVPPLWKGAEYPTHCDSRSHDPGRGRGVQPRAEIASATGARGLRRLSSAAPHGAEEGFEPCAIDRFLRPCRGDRVVPRAATGSARRSRGFASPVAAFRGPFGAASALGAMCRILSGGGWGGSSARHKRDTYHSQGGTGGLPASGSSGFILPRPRARSRRPAPPRPR
jgi:hypothetical protein